MYMIGSAALDFMDVLDLSVRQNAENRNGKTESTVGVESKSLMVYCNGHESISDNVHRLFPLKTF